MKQLIFDFDGTLVDSMDNWSGAMLRVLRENNVEIPSDILKIITPLGYEGTAEYYIKTFGLRQTKAELMKLMGEYCFAGYRDTIPAKETVTETLRELKHRGYGLNVLTASPHSVLDICLERVGIYGLFDNIWSCDDFSTTKSDEKIYPAAAKRIGTAVENCIFLDDNINAVSTAKAAGMPVIGVYDKSSHDYTAQMKEVCGEYIYKFSELLEILESGR